MKYWLYKIAAIAFLLNVQLAYAEEAADTQPDETVSAVFPYSLEETHGLISQEFNSDDRSYFDDYNGAIYVLPNGAKTVKDLSEEEYNALIAFPLVHPTKFYVFYGAYPYMQSRLNAITPENAVLEENPALESYANLSPDARKNDIYLWSPDAPYWYSEITRNGKALPFRSYFILHIYAQDKSNTVVEIIEDGPTAKFGKRLSVDAHGLIHHYDIRPVKPTLRDRQFLLSCIGQFLERGIPSRKGFTCRG